MRVLSFAALALLCSGCVAVQPAPPPPDPKAQLPALETRITQLIDQERGTLDPGEQPLSVDDELVKVARQRSTDMAVKNYFANKSPDGQTSASMIMKEDAKWQGLLGENIAAQHYNPAAALDVNALAQSFVDTWMKSPAHKENLSFKSYSRTGVGAAANGDTIYVTELFASDMGLKPPPDDDAKPDSQSGTQDKRTITELAHPAVEKTVPTPRPRQ
jgi:uncharacterized protein YkwD